MAKFYERPCPGCGAVYEVREVSIPFRDKDSESCSLCGETVISWNGGCIISIKLKADDIEPS